MISRLALVLSFVMFFCSTASAQSPQQQREEILKMRQEVLSRLYKEKPAVRQEIKQSKGYAVFSNIGVNVLLLSTGRGSGVTRNNRTGKDVFMKMASVGAGVGLGVKDFRAVFVFHSTEALNKFLTEGWDLSAQADAAVKSDAKGDSAAMAATANQGVSVYQLTENGIALQATLQGTKYWADEDLN